MRSRLILGVDPSLGRTGWGVVLAECGRLAHVAHGTISTPSGRPTAGRLAELDRQLAIVLAGHRPAEVAVEEIFQNANPRTTILLAEARGVVLCAAARAGARVHELAARSVKKALTGSGRADKPQVAAMVARLLPGLGRLGADESDALAVAIACAHGCLAEPSALPPATRAA